MQRKNARRKKYGVYPVHILRSEVDIMRVMIPLEDHSYKISLPLSVYYESPAGSLHTLQERIVSSKLLSQGTLA